MTDLVPKLTCGIVMPISAIDGCSEGHWTEVQSILSDAIEEAGFEPNLVSNADDVGIIHKRIIQNLYENPIVVCDASGKNPNVMFELGLRLAFDKPTIIVKDDKTSYSFDTSAIEHLEYPRDLRFSQIVDFKQRLSDKIRATHDRANSDPSYTTFLKHFGEFTVAKIAKKEVSGQEFMFEELKEIRASIQRLESSRSDINRREMLRPRLRKNSVDVCLKGNTEAEVSSITKILLDFPGVIEVNTRSLGDDHKHIEVRLDEFSEVAESRIRSIIRPLRRKIENPSGNN